MYVLERRSVDNLTRQPGASNLDAKIPVDGEVVDVDFWLSKGVGALQMMTEQGERLGKNCRCLL